MGTQGGRVLPLPPLPEIPPPPESPLDPRQTTVARITGSLGAQLGGQMHLRGPQLATGFRAASVDLAELSAVLTGGIAKLDAAQVAARWNDDVFAWLSRAVLRWVQRVKMVRIERDESSGGIHVLLETQDDHGYYHYEFDVFPRTTRPQ